MITGTYDELKDLPDTHYCPEHDNPLTVAKHPELDCCVIRCGHGHYPEELLTKATKTALFRRGEIKAVDLEFNLLPTTDLASHQPLTLDQVQLIISHARRYDLDPYRGHVVLMYGVPYFGLDAYLYYAKRSGKVYSLTSRPLTGMERTDYQVEEGSHAWISYVKLLPDGGTFSGLGIVKKSELTEMSKRTPGQLRYPVVAEHPWQMAQKRAEWQAMRRGFPIGESDKQEVE